MAGRICDQRIASEFGSGLELPAPCLHSKQLVNVQQSWGGEAAGLSSLLIPALGHFLREFGSSLPVCGTGSPKEAQSSMAWDRSWSQGGFWPCGSSPLLPTGLQARSWQWLSRRQLVPHTDISVSWLLAGGEAAEGLLPSSGEHRSCCRGVASPSSFALCFLEFFLAACKLLPDFGLVWLCRLPQGPWLREQSRIPRP